MEVQLYGKALIPLKVKFPTSRTNALYSNTADLMYLICRQHYSPLNGRNKNNKLNQNFT